MTAPYQLLSGTTYTSDITVYSYKNYTLKIINKENPDKLLLHITKNVRVNASEAHANINHKLPYWSNSAPNILKTLDFSKVDGQKTEYKIGDDYRLTLLAKQGCWGKVYVLEHLSKGAAPEKICAVKLLLTRTDKQGDMSTQDFRERHQQEIDSNVQLATLGLDIAIVTYGIIENDPDHYLLFLEYGENAHNRFKAESRDTSIDHIHDFMNAIDTFHVAGYAHGDLKIDNMLFVNNTLKLCDWFRPRVGNCKN